MKGGEGLSTYQTETWQHVLLLQIQECAIKHTGELILSEMTQGANGVQQRHKAIFFCTYCLCQVLK